MDSEREREEGKNVFQPAFYKVIVAFLVYAKNEAWWLQSTICIHVAHSKAAINILRAIN